MNDSLENTLYHSFLRVAVCVVALLLVFDSGLLSETTSRVSKNTQVYLANAVGVKASVAPNEVNELTGRISELEQELERKERQIAVNLNDGGATANNSTFILSIILFILLVLIVLNYALDFLRLRQQREEYREGVS